MESTSSTIDDNLSQELDTKLKIDRNINFSIRCNERQEIKDRIAKRTILKAKARPTDTKVKIRIDNVDEAKSAKKRKILRDPILKVECKSDNDNKRRRLDVLQSNLSSKKARSRLPCPLGYQSTVCNVFYPHQHDLIINPWQMKKIRTGININTKGKHYTTTFNAPSMLQRDIIIAPTILDNTFNNGLCIYLINIGHRQAIIKFHDIIAQIKFQREID